MKTDLFPIVLGLAVLFPVLSGCGRKPDTKVSSAAVSAIPAANFDFAAAQKALSKLDPTPLGGKGYAIRYEIHLSGTDVEFDTIDLNVAHDGSGRLWVSAQLAKNDKSGIVTAVTDGRTAIVKANISGLPVVDGYFNLGEMIDYIDERIKKEFLTSEFETGFFQELIDRPLKHGWYRLLWTLR